jgi:hypothetical protein
MRPLGRPLQERDGGRLSGDASEDGCHLREG